MTKYILIIALLLNYTGSFAQENPEVYHTLSKKNFYFLHAIENMRMKLSEHIYC